jgi:hypothetical protein
LEAGNCWELRKKEARPFLEAGNCWELRKKDKIEFICQKLYYVFTPD